MLAHFVSEILDKYIGEAEKKVRDLFAPAELEYQISGDDSALHIIILDEMDAIARKRGTMTADTTGVRDSVVNQLLAKMDGVKEASNVLVIGLTNRPELLDPALLRLCFLLSIYLLSIYFIDSLTLVCDFLVLYCLSPVFCL